MNRLFGMMRYNKQLLIVFISFVLEACFVFGVVVFDIIQLISTRNNAVKISPAFVPLNISLIAVVGLSLILVLAMFVIKKLKGRQNEFKAN